MDLSADLTVLRLSKIVDMTPIINSFPMDWKTAND
jgi:hypothetical protein